VSGVAPLFIEEHHFYAGDFDVLIVHHTEDPDPIGEGVMNDGELAARLGLHGIPKASETIMLERDLRLVALTGSRYHAASITCRESLDVLKRAKDQGMPVTASASNVYRPDARAR